jgi:adiponectin receptor
MKNKPYIGRAKFAPDYETKEQPHLQRGWRINYSTWTRALKSICECHNETFNVWSHLLGALVFLGMVFYFIAMDPEVNIA